MVCVCNSNYILCFQPTQNKNLNLAIVPKAIKTNFTSTVQNTKALICKIINNCYGYFMNDLLRNLNLTKANIEKN